MQRWSLATLAVSFVIAVLFIAGLFAVLMFLPPFYEMVSLVAPLLVALLTAFLAIFLVRVFSGPLTRAAWHAEERSKLLLLLMGRDNTITPIIPKGALESVLEFSVGGNTVYYYLHPQSVIAVPGSRARLALAHIKNPSTLPPDTALVSFDIRHLKGYDHAAHYVYLEKFKEQRDALAEKYRELLMLAREALESEEAFQTRKKRILQLVNELGFEPSKDSLSLSEIIQVADYNLRVLENLDKEHNSNVIAPPLLEAIRKEPHKIKLLDTNASVRTVTPSDVEAMLLTYSLPHILRHFHERALYIALQNQMRGLLGGLNTRTLILIILMFVVLIAILQVFGGGGGGILP